MHAQCKDWVGTAFDNFEKGLHRLNYRLAAKLNRVQMTAKYKGGEIALDKFMHAKYKDWVGLALDKFEKEFLRLNYRLTAKSNRIRMAAKCRDWIGIASDKALQAECRDWIGIVSDK